MKNTWMCAVILGVALGGSALVATAKTPAKKSATPPAAVWTKEPTSFLGFEFGQPLPDTLPACPRGDRELAYTTTSCLQGSDPIFRMWRAPDLGFAYSNSIFLYSGKVASVTLKVNDDSYQALKSLLITRYGPPTNASISTVKSLVGAEFRSEELAWIGTNVDISLYQRYDKVDESAVFVQNKALMKASMDQDRAKHGDPASKL
ncbi:hypothetical protein ACU8YE_19065 [Ralstonia sp. VS2407]